MRAVHFIKRCREHGKVLGQCRCPAPDKTIREVACPGYPSCGPSPKPITGEICGPDHPYAGDMKITNESSSIGRCYCGQKVYPNRTQQGLSQ